ncbi:MAG TPA: serine protein kinase RIO [Methanocorpusculum sp.]|nr:serine protein kinase RIO [Methanocorpusculum sp.]
MKSTSNHRDYIHENIKKIKKLDQKFTDINKKIRKDDDDHKVIDEVFDETTLLALYKLVNKKVIKSIGGSISTGKEANVFIAEYTDKAGEKSSAAVKIYRMRTGNFTTMSEYVLGDPRFSNIKQTHKDIIFSWTKKEYSNLSRCRDAGIPCPKPIAFDRNILIMEFLGEKGIPYPQIRKRLPKSPKETYQEAICLIRDLYQKANLVHGDFSEYNILSGEEELILIDMGQAVTPEHPKAYNFLYRDIRNINKFFAQKCRISNELDLFRNIVGEEFFKR